MGKLEKYLSLFDLDRNFDKNDLKSAYRTLSKVWHPDRFETNKKLRNKAEEKFKEINNGYEYLKEYLNNRSAYSSATSQETEQSTSQKKSSKNYQYKNQRKTSHQQSEKNDNQETKKTTKNKTNKTSFNWSAVWITIAIILVVVVVSQNSSSTSKDNKQTVEQNLVPKTNTRANNSKLNEPNVQDYEGYEYYEEALKLEENQRFRQALEYLNKAIELSPKFSKAYSARGGVKYVLQDWRSGLKDYNKAIELNPNNVEAYVNRGLTKSELDYSSKEICSDIIKAKKLGSDAPFVIYSDCFDQ